MSLTLLRKEHVSDFRREHQRTPIIPLVEIRKNQGRLLSLIFVNEMPCVGKNLELILSCSE